MTATDPTSDYALGSTDAEHERLIRSRSAPVKAPFTWPNKVDYRDRSYRKPIE